MRKTTFAGLTVLTPGEGLESDSGAFTDGDRDIIDHFLQIGAKLHRHNGKLGLAVPTQGPSASIIASGGAIPPDLTISVGYTLEDEVGGETTLSPLSVVTTGPALEVPLAAPSAAIDYTGGSLGVNNYYYGLTWIDGDGGETPLGPTVEAERAPGFASGRVKLSNLNFDMAVAGAVGWRLYRAIGGGMFDYLASGGVGSSTFTDDGTTAVNCDIHPPLDSENSTRQVNTLQVALPAADANISAAQQINLYVTTSGDFGQSSLLDSFPIASAGASPTYASLEAISDRRPPDVNLSVGGANQIDPDTELLDWHWKRPVTASAQLPSGVLGDVRVAEDTGNLYAVLAPRASANKPPEWTRIASAAGGAGPAELSASAAATKVSAVTELDFAASGGASVGVANTGAGKALVTIGASASLPPGEAEEDLEGLWPKLKVRLKKITGAKIALGASEALRWYKESKILAYLFATTSGAEFVHLSNSGEANEESAALTVEKSGTTLQARVVLSLNGLLEELSRIIFNSEEKSHFQQLSSARKQRDFGRVETLPESPSVGDTCSYLADKTNGVVWRLEYDGEGEFPWKKIGGSPIDVEAGAGSITTSESTYQTASQPAYTLPLAGDYDVEWFATVTNGATADNLMRMGLFLGGTENQNCFVRSNYNGGGAAAYNRVRCAGVAKSTSVNVRYRSDSKLSCTFFRMKMIIDPVRVG